MSHDDTRDEQLSRLYREAAGEEPSEAIDRAILAAARAEAAPVQPRKRAWWQTWAGPASVAATVVLTVTLTLMVQQEQEHAFIEAPPSKGEAADSAVKPASPPPAVKQEAAPREAERVVGATRQAQEAAEAAPAPKPLARETKAEPAAPAGALAPRAPMAEPAELAAPAKPAAVMRQQAAPAADAVELRARSAPLRKEAVGAAPARTPEQWLEDIRRLKQQGKDKEAAEALADFRKAYPDFRLPDDLR